MNPFDNLKAKVFDTVGTIMGNDAVWIPSNGSFPAGYTARVLFNNPTEKQRLSDVDYDPTNWTIEYRFTQFPGLKQIIDTSATSEMVTVDGNLYGVRAINKKWDGDTYIAILEPQ